MNDRATIRELECFVAVAEELNFAKAAQRINLSQPPLTRHIQQLEDRLGTPLLIRNTRVVELTPAGALFLEDTREVLRLLDRAVETVRRARQGQATRMSIGFVGALLEGEMIETLRHFRTHVHSCQIRLHDMLSPDLINAVQQRQIDGAFIGATPHRMNDELRTIFWRREAFKVALPLGHRLAAAGEVDLRDFADEKWITLQEKASPALYQRMLQLCEDAGFRPTVLEESDRWTAIIAMVALGEGVCLIPESATKLDPEGDGSVLFKPLAQADAVLERRFLFHCGNKSPLLASLVKVLEKREQGRTARVQRRAPCDGLALG